jgi:hypothetical protein
MVRVEVPLVADAAVPSPTAGNVVSVPQDDSGSDGKGNNDLGNDDGESSNHDNGEDKAMHIPLRKTPSRIMWYICPVCLEEEYDSEGKVVLHALEVIKQDVVERCC